VRVDLSSQVIIGTLLRDHRRAGRSSRESAVALRKAHMDSVTGLYENKPSVAAVFPVLGPERVEP
jgi:hypothetical protein